MHLTNDYVNEVPVEDARPAYNFMGNMFNTTKVNNNLKQVVGAITPENKVIMPPRKIDTFLSNNFWPDDNPQQNPINKFVNNINKTNPQYEIDLVRTKPHQVDILDEPDIFNFSNSLEETPEATRPKRFNDFFNKK